MKRREREAPTQKIKISNYFHGSRVTKFRTMGNVHDANRPDARRVSNFAMDNGLEASRCGQDWLHDRELLVLYTYQMN